MVMEIVSLTLLNNGKMFSGVVIPEYSPTDCVLKVLFFLIHTSTWLLLLPG